jgi:Fic family protein
MARTYESTHPWLTFTLDLRSAPHTLWLLLGEAQSKAEHVAGVPLLPSVQKQFHQMFLAKGVLATTAIEGNTLSEEQVRQHLEGGLELPPSMEYLKQEIDNIIDACNVIGGRVLSGASSGISVGELLEFNRLVLRDLPLAEEVVPGEFRQHSVTVGRYRGAPWQDVPYLTDRLTAWLNTGFEPTPGCDKAFGLLKAIMAHLYIAWIHPFGDGNGRTARLVELEILLGVGIPTVAAHLLSNHYNQTRAEYYRQLDLAHSKGGDPIGFIEYALQGFVDGIREQIETVRGQQIMVHWVNFIHQVFQGQDAAAGRRQRRLAIDLSESEKPVKAPDIRRLTPRLAEAYAGKTDKTVTRDLNKLRQLELIEKTKDGYRARPELMLAFLPPARVNETEGEA